MRVAAVLAAAVVAWTAPGDFCQTCHEIAPAVRQWRASSHRGIACEKCHGGSLQSANLRRVVTHSRGQVPEQIRLELTQVRDMVERCRSCHQQQFAEWFAGPHGTRYGRIFLDAKHNASRQLTDDCLRCHGMFYDGGIGDVVAPLTSKGPWRIVRPGLEQLAAIPCLACHSVHTDGEPFQRDTKRAHRPSLAFWDRRASEHIGVAMLAVPAVLEGSRTVKMSVDKRQALCYQCHAPLAARQAWSGDDHTPLGVHEGLSCLACHQRHGEDTRASCGTCHPRLSNCGLDVEKMDTTFVNLKSAHNIHTVKCLDCHPKGVPKAKGTVAAAR